ncbi:SigE family RNA polymerase sigma factor [Actinacidiphila rubida]|uniref:RNA polymerase sigma-70 factor, sigma-E family n=1 Tax=Actinacidiphila rubida TaxID=310780 RepID=A0A1H8GRV7_9ACTN|nr:SigE family RNA polymerase sigma factor [Actinacidiphila rubida]SEN46841.1 RNA polymerase sigma-70 factor, sigma-E family [Actinacidiphila rubida]
MTGTDGGSLAAPARHGDLPGPQAPPSEGAPDFAAYAAARWSRLVCTAYLLTGDHREAEDLAQAALAKAYLRWPRIGRLDEPDAYLHRALVNDALARQRRRRVARLLGPRRTARDGDQAELLGALAQLPARQRVVVVLRYWADLSDQQVADVLGCPVATAAGQAARGLRRLRAHPALATPGGTEGAAGTAGTAPAVPAPRTPAESATDTGEEGTR